MHISDRRTNLKLEEEKKRRRRWRCWWI